jgi:hypothetical protein
MQSINMISSTGRMPDCAAPIATPVIAASLIGVLGPNSSASQSLLTAEWSDHYCFTSAEPSTRWTASTILSSLGMTNASSGSL